MAEGEGPVGFDIVGATEACTFLSIPYAATFARRTTAPHGVAHSSQSVSVFEPGGMLILIWRLDQQLRIVIERVRVWLEPAGQLCRLSSSKPPHSASGHLSTHERNGFRNLPEQSIRRSFQFPDSKLFSEIVVRASGIDKIT